ncbi:MAG: hypothetical protein ACP5JF_03130 [Candidatus Methanodesulfokora sp.]|jgi:hypothetical protein
MTEKVKAVGLAEDGHEQCHTLYRSPSLVQKANLNGYFYGLETQGRHTGVIKRKRLITGKLGYA